MNESNKIANLNRIARRAGVNATFAISPTLQSLDREALVEVVEQVQMLPAANELEDEVVFGFGKHTIIAKVDYEGPADSVETHRHIRIMTDKD